MAEELHRFRTLPSAASKLWESDVFTLQGQHVTVGHLVLAVVLLVVGFVLARIARNRLSLALLRQVDRGRSHVSATDRTILEKGAFLLVFLVAVDVALNLVGIRPSTLHFLAGGLAIGFGFGAKELINNLISGAIVLVERPVQIGDIVEVGEEVGRVEEIGIRSIRLQTIERLDVLLPNRVFLEEKVINWTKHSHIILDKVTVGISYNSDIHLAMQVMAQAAKVEGVLSQPAPFILFASHGESTLLMDAYYAVKLAQPIERYQFRSRVNVALNDALRAAKIEIAYPQLDLHVESGAAVRDVRNGS